MEKEEKQSVEEDLKQFIGLDLSTASMDIIELFLDETDDPSVFEEVLKTNAARPEILKLLYGHHDTPDNVRAEAAMALRLPVKTFREIEEIKKKELEKMTAKSKEARTESLLMRIQKLSVSERVRLAMRGNKEVRSLLLKDTNKEVILSVLDNPKLTESEVELVARSRNIIEEALRKIARNREWMKSYAVVLALVTNPKTPAGMAMGFVSSLKPKDLNLLEKNKNVAEAVRSAAKRLLGARKR